MVTIKKAQFAGINCKIYYFSNGITSLHYGHPLLDPTRQEEKNCKKTDTFIQEKKFKFLKKEAKVVSKCERKCILRSIFSQPLT